MGIASIPVNYYLTYPFYYHFMPKDAILGAYQLIVPSMESILQCLVCFNFPFCFQRFGISCSIIVGVQTFVTNLKREKVNKVIIQKGVEQTSFFFYELMI